MKKVLFGVTAILMIGLLAACSNGEETNKDKEQWVTPVETEAAVKGDFILEKSAYGRTSPASTTPIMLPTPGEVDSLEIENGDQVKEDDLIATINTPAGKQNIRASKDGQIVNLKAAEGDTLSNEEPFAVIANMDNMKLTFTVTADTQALFSKDDTLTVVINDDEYEAKVSTIGMMPDDTGLYPIEATVKNKDAKILPGMVATLTVPEEKLKDVIIVPAEAVSHENEEAFVYVIKKDKANKVKVTVKEVKSDETAIKGDVKADDQVVVNGQLTLTDGSQVSVQKGE